jgi:hypothetical protein
MADGTVTKPDENIRLIEQTEKLLTQAIETLHRIKTKNTLQGMNRQNCVAQLKGVSLRLLNELKKVCEMQ